VRLRLEAGETDIVLIVEDDGDAASADPGPKTGMGLLGMQERVISLGGTLNFERPPTGGARIVVSVPNTGVAP
jgi:signal transduction histidine kinase